MTAALVAVVAVTAGRLLGWQGVDFPAQVYRVDAWRRVGFSLWDFRWYGGHWTLDYSVLFPPLAATLGIGVLTVACAGVAAVSFDRLARPALGSAGWPASLIFAAGTVVPASIGQLPFLAGEAFGLPALLAAARGRWIPASVLTLACTLSSPLAGAFLALALAAWSLPSLLGRRGGALAPVGLAVLAVAPVLAAAALFPGDGPMPYPAVDYLWELVVAATVAALAGRRFPVVLAGAGLFAAAATVSVCVPSPLGGNVGRIEDAVALPLAVGFAWDRAGRLAPRVVLVAAAGVPLALSQWSPAWGAMTSIPRQPSTRAAFYAPLDRRLLADAAGGPPGRVEVVPTAFHWESVYVARVMPLARGWERQLDVADNPIFYRPGALTPLAYRAWLLDNGVRFVALPRAPLDMAGRAEGRLVESGRVPGLEPVWANKDWRLFRVAGSPGIVAAPDRLVRASDARVVVAAVAGTAVVRIRYSPDWRVSRGRAEVTRAPGSWIELRVATAGQVTLTLRPFA